MSMLGQHWRTARLQGGGGGWCAHLRQCKGGGSVGSRAPLHEGLQLVAQLLLLLDLQVALHELLAGPDQAPLQQLHLLDQLVRSWVTALQLPPPAAPTRQL